MSGVLDWSRYLNLFYTVKDIREHFPLEQEHIVYDFNGLGADGWTGSLNWQTLIIDRMRYDIFNNPKFDESTVIGYYPEGSLTGLTPPQLVLPAGMYTGPIIPDSFENVPITVVSFDFEKGTEKFSLQLLLIENWQIGIELGDPRDNADFSPVDGLDSTLLIFKDKNTVLVGDTITLSTESDIPETEPLPPNPVVKFYRRTGPVSQVFLGSAPFINRRSSFTFNSSVVPVSTASFFATFAGTRRYRFERSADIQVDVISGYPLDVNLKLTPSTATINTSILSTASAKISSGFPSTSSIFINNSTTFTVTAKSPFSGEVLNPVRQNSFFSNAFFETNFITTSGYIPTNLNLASYVTSNARSDGVNYIYSATITKDYTANLAWGPIYPHFIPPGSTSTNLRIITTQTRSEPLIPLTINVIDPSLNQSVNNIFNATTIQLQASSNLDRDQKIAPSAITFDARFSPDYNILDYTSARTPPTPASTSTAKISMRTLYLEKNEVPVVNSNPLMIGKTFKFPGSEVPNNAAVKFDSVDTGTYTVLSISTLTSGLYSGTNIITISPNWQIHPLSENYRKIGNTTSSKSVPQRSTYQPVSFTWTATSRLIPNVGEGETLTNPYYVGFDFTARGFPFADLGFPMFWSSEWINTVTNQSIYLKAGPTATFRYKQTILQQYDALTPRPGTFTNINSGYWRYSVYSDQLYLGPNPDGPREDDWRAPVGEYFENTTSSFQAKPIIYDDGNFNYDIYQDLIFDRYIRTGTATALYINRGANVAEFPAGFNGRRGTELDFPFVNPIFPQTFPIEERPPEIVRAQQFGINNPISPTGIDRVLTQTTSSRYLSNQIAKITSQYTFDNAGNVREKDILYFNQLPVNVTTGTTLVINTVTYSVYSTGTNLVRVDPPWYNHVTGDFTELHDDNIIFSNPSSSEAVKYSVHKITEMKYVGLGIPYFTGPYVFNKIKISNASLLRVGTIFYIQGGPLSPVNKIFSITALADSQGFFTISPAYLISSYTETEQWRRDNETYQYFLDFDRNRDIVFYTDPFVSNLLSVEQAKTPNVLVLENIPTNLRLNARFTSTLPAFSGTYVITNIDPLRESITVSPSWTSGQLNSLSQWNNKKFTFTNTVSNTSTVILGVATAVNTQTNFNTTWSRNMTLEPGTYQVGARLTPVFELGSQAPLRYSTTSTSRFTIQSAPGFIAPLDLEFQSISSTQTRVTMVCNGAVSVDPNHYYVFEEPARFFSQENLLGTSAWTKTANKLEQRASLVVNNVVLTNSFQVRWAGSMNYNKTFEDQYLFQSSILAIQ